MSATQDFVRKQQTGDPLTKLVLRVVADYANWETGVCYPAIDRIAADCECSRSTVSRRLQDLHDQGFIHLEIRAGRQSVITLIGYAEWFASLPVKTFNRNLPQSTDDQVASVRHGSPKSTGHGVKSTGHGGHVCETHEIYNINILPNSFEKGLEDSSTTSEVEETRVYYQDGNLKLCDSLNQFWLPHFGNIQGDLDLALIQISSFVNPQNKLHSLERQVSSQLSRLVRDRRDKDRRYQSAKTNSANGKASSDQMPKSAHHLADEFFEKLKRGEIKQ